jgi:ABC-type proline/glycine betaine transport system permease subunit
MVSNSVILAGAIPAAVLAIAADLCFGLFESRLSTRWARQR